MANRPDVIYVLIDPRTDEVRYVGKTNQVLLYRLSAHLRETLKCHRCNWIAELKRQGLKPSIMAIETCERMTWQETERFWIRSFKLAGARLTNNTSGGDGVCDLPKETRDRLSKVWVGRKHSPETMEKFNNRRPGFKHSPETKTKMSKAQSGREILWKDRIAESVRKLTPEQVVEVQRSIAAGEMVISVSKRLNLHRTTVSKIKAGTYFDRYRRSK